ncbi:MAG: PTS sugar transporter subunit IIA [bacterium]|nr:PTS sugar transporter subunit IIA [bacterium]
MSLLEILDKNCIKTDIQSLDKLGSIQELTELLFKNKKISDKSQVINDVLKREAKGSTGIGKGIGVPHAKTAAVSKLTLAIGVSREGVDFTSIDGKYVHILFLLLAPPHSAGPHVEALSEIARLITPPGIKEKIKNASSSEEIITIITEYYNS